MSPEVKICGLTSHGDARAAVEAGAAYLGVVFAASSPRCREPESAIEIWGDLPAVRVGVFVDSSADRIRRLTRRLGLGVVQLHGSEGPALCAALAEDGEGPLIWKAVRLREPADLHRALDRYGGCVDGILLEGWSAAGAGGVGARFDWSWVRATSPDWPAGVKMILAGGLEPGNVGAAVEALRPDVVDVSSGVEESPGVKEIAAIRAFLGAVRGSARR